MTYLGELRLRHMATSLEKELSSMAESERNVLLKYLGKSLLSEKSERKNQLIASRIKAARFQFGCVNQFSAMDEIFINNEAELHFVDEKTMKAIIKSYEEDKPDVCDKNKLSYEDHVEFSYSIGKFDDQYGQVITLKAKSSKQTNHSGTGEKIEPTFKDNEETEIAYDQAEGTIFLVPFGLFEKVK
jgi:hypothetical protein